MCAPLRPAVSGVTVGQVLRPATLEPVGGCAVRQPGPAYCICPPGRVTSTASGRRVATWLGLVTCFAVAIAWVVSFPISPAATVVWIRYRIADYDLGFCLGRLWFFTDLQHNVRGLRTNWRPVKSIPSGSKALAISWPYYVRSPGGFSGSVPLRLVLVVVGVHTAILWHRDRRRIPPGQCPKCGYDLTLNASGTCPERGKPTAVESPV